MRGWEVGGFAGGRSTGGETGTGRPRSQVGVVVVDPGVLLGGSSSDAAATGASRSKQQSACEGVKGVQGEVRELDVGGCSRGPGRRQLGRVAASFGCVWRAASQSPLTSGQKAS